MKPSFGIIYFLQLETPDGRGPIKVGYTKTSVRGRIATLQQSSPYRIKWLGFFDGSYIEERKAHRKLFRDQIRGEWFHPTQDVLDFIAKMSPGFVPVFADDIPYEKPQKGVTRLHVEIPSVGANA